ncbi:hypothetical protein PORY_001946 [Pneumocystis oryctolagi]|uniref:Uncharacterized protein n=1 Tax=Pneumocystis oryctolagi TaxID=42067 RepID=A0ACB7CC93_9ASCO|nr:hypothetical protein PORY_001946 [Pneumocystis oryctolagi]
MAEKAQYFLEKSFPEIIDLKRKKIFTPEEINSILRKRTEFEYALARRIVKKSDFLKYAEYEMNLEELRKKRMKRLNIKGKPSISDWGGTRRIFFIFERATQKFHGDLDLWFQYIRYAQHEKSTKVLGKVIATALQFHPTKPKLWIFAGYHELNWNNNMSAARILMQRGLRLNMYSSELWLEYCRMELLYIISLSEKHKIIEIHKTKENDQSPYEETLDKNINDTKRNDIVVLSDISVEKSKENHTKILEENIEPNYSLNDSTLDSQNNPVLNGEIVSIIIKTSNMHMPDNIELLESFYYMIESFNNLKCQRRLLDEIVCLIQKTSITDLAKTTLLTLPLHKFLKDISNISFPAALKSSILEFNTLSTQMDCSKASYEKFCLLLSLFLDEKDLDENLRILIRSFLHTILKKLETLGYLSPKLVKLQKHIS